MSDDEFTEISIDDVDALLRDTDGCGSFDPLSPELASGELPDGTEVSIETTNAIRGEEDLIIHFGGTVNSQHPDVHIPLGVLIRSALDGVQSEGYLEGADEAEVDTNE